MSQWETLSFKELNSEPHSISRFTSGDKPKTEEIIVKGEETYFDGETCWLSHDVVDGYIISANDTSDMASIKRLWSNNVTSARRYGESLYSYEVNGHSIEKKNNLLEKLPDWVKVSGNWKYMDK